MPRRPSLPLQLESLEDRVTPSVTVTTTLDPATPIAGQLSLREAIAEVNAGRVADNTIILKAGTYQNMQGALNVTHSLILQGASAGNTILDGGGKDRVVLIDPAAAVNVQISGVTVRNGNTNRDGGGIDVQDVGGQSSVLTVRNSIITANTAGSIDFGGGGIAANNGDINVLNCQVTNNLVTGRDAFGGGIADNNQGTGNITVTDSLIAGNTAPSAGGGVGELEGGPGALTITGSTIRDNTLTTAAFGGGGVFANTTGAVKISNSTIRGNTSLTDGGGFEEQFQGPATIFLSNDTIDGNQSTQGNGGGIAILTDSALTLQNNTLNGNSAALAGGGLSDTGNGAIVLRDSAFGGNTAGTSGGGVEDTDAALTVANSTFDTNKANNGNGGGIDIAGGTNPVALTNVTFRGNSVTGNFNAGGGNGGGLNDGTSGGTLALRNCLIVDNQSSVDGGGVFQFLGTLIVSDSQFTGNTAGSNGGGLLGSVTTYTISGSTFNNNHAGLGGGIAIGGNGTFVPDLSSLLVNDTFTGNSASLQDGGLGLDGNQPVTLQDDTIAGNSATFDFGGLEVSSPVSLQNMILAGNTAHNLPDISSPRTLTDLGGNLIGTLGGLTGFTKPTDRIGVNPLLGPLADNGGMLAGSIGDQQVVQTEALLVGSPALGTGVGNGTPTTDERGFSRVVNGRTDIGAFQFQDVPLSVAVAPVTPTLPLNTTETVTVTVRNTGNIPLPADNGTLTVTLPVGLTVPPGTSLTFPLGTLAAGQSESFSLTVTATQLGSHVLSASVTSVDANPVTSTATITGVQPPPVTNPVTMTGGNTNPVTTTHTPMGALSLFGFGFGPGFQLDLFEVDSQGELFAVPFGATKGTPTFLNPDVVFANLRLLNGAIVGDLTTTGDQMFFTEILNFTNPFVFQALLKAVTSHA